MNFSRKLKLLLIGLAFLLCGHAPWGQHEVYRQMHMLVMCSKTDHGAFEFTKDLVFVLDEYLPEAKARAARARDTERLADLLITNQIPLAIISNELLETLTKSNSDIFQNLLETSKTLYTFSDMVLIVNHDFPKKHMKVIINSLSEASRNNYDTFRFIKKNNLSINYDEIVLETIKF